MCLHKVEEGWFDVVSTCMHARSVASNSATPWTVAYQTPLSKECSKQEYWSGLSFLPLGEDPGIECNKQCNNVRLLH